MSVVNGDSGKPLSKSHPGFRQTLNKVKSEKTWVSPFRQEKPAKPSQEPIKAEPKTAQTTDIPKEDTEKAGSESKNIEPLAADVSSVSPDAGVEAVAADETTKPEIAKEAESKSETTEDKQAVESISGVSATEKKVEDPEQKEGEVIVDPLVDLGGGLKLPQSKIDAIAKQNLAGNFTAIDTKAAEQSKLRELKNQKKAELKALKDQNKVNSTFAKFKRKLDLDKKSFNAEHAQKVKELESTIASINQQIKDFDKKTIEEIEAAKQQHAEKLIADDNKLVEDKEKAEKDAAQKELDRNQEIHDSHVSQKRHEIVTRVLHAKQSEYELNLQLLELQLTQQNREVAKHKGINHEHSATKEDLEAKIQALKSTIADNNAQIKKAEEEGIESTKSLKTTEEELAASEQSLENIRVELSAIRAAKSSRQSRLLDAGSKRKAYEEEQERLKIEAEKEAEQQRISAEENAKEEEEARLLRAQQERQRIADEKEAERLAEEERLRLEEEERARQAEEARIAQEAEEARIAQEAEEARIAKEAEEARIAQEAEEARIAKEAEEARIAKEAEEARIAKEAEELKHSREAELQELIEEKDAEILKLKQEAEKVEKSENAAIIVEPVSKSAVVDEPVATSADVSEPVAKTAVVSEPVAKSAVVSEPVSKSAVVNEPVAQQVKDAPVEPESTNKSAPVIVPVVAPVVVSSHSSEAKEAKHGKKKRFSGLFSSFKKKESSPEKEESDKSNKSGAVGGVLAGAGAAVAGTVAAGTLVGSTATGAASSAIGSGAGATGNVAKDVEIPAGSSKAVETPSKNFESPAETPVLDSVASVKDLELSGSSELGSKVEKVETPVLEAEPKALDSENTVVANVVKEGEEPIVAVQATDENVTLEEISAEQAKTEDEVIAIVPEGDATLQKIEPTSSELPPSASVAASSLPTPPQTAKEPVVQKDAAEDIAPEKEETLPAGTYTEPAAVVIPEEQKFTVSEEVLSAPVKDTLTTSPELKEASVSEPELLASTTRESEVTSGVSTSRESTPEPASGLTKKAKKNAKKKAARKRKRAAAAAATATAPAVIATGVATDSPSVVPPAEEAEGIVEPEADTAHYEEPKPVEIPSDQKFTALALSEDATAVAGKEVKVAENVEPITVESPFEAKFIGISGPSPSEGSFEKEGDFATPPAISDDLTAKGPEGVKVEEPTPEIIETATDSLAFTTLDPKHPGETVDKSVLAETGIVAGKEVEEISTPVKDEAATPVSASSASKNVTPPQETSASSKPSFLKRFLSTSSKSSPKSSPVGTPVKSSPKDTERPGSKRNGSETNATSSVSPKKQQQDPIPGTFTDDATSARVGALSDKSIVDEPKDESLEPEAKDDSSLYSFREVITYEEFTEEEAKALYNAAVKV